MQICSKEIEYLGHVVSQEGLRTTPRLVKTVTEFQVPDSVQETRRFLGFSSYYRRFIPRIAQQLHVLTRKNVPFLWSQDCNRAFEELNRRLTYKQCEAVLHKNVHTIRNFLLFILQGILMYPYKTNLSKTICTTNCS